MTKNDKINCENASNEYYHNCTQILDRVFLTAEDEKTSWNNMIMYIDDYVSGLEEDPMQNELRSNINMVRHIACDAKTKQEKKEFLTKILNVSLITIQYLMEENYQELDRDNIKDVNIAITSVQVALSAILSQINISPLSQNNNKGGSNVLDSISLIVNIINSSVLIYGSLHEEKGASEVKLALQDSWHMVINSVFGYFLRECFGRESDKVSSLMQDNLDILGSGLLSYVANDNEPVEIIANDNILRFSDRIVLFNGMEGTFTDYVASCFNKPAFS